MDGARGFAANHFYDARMSMAEGVDGDAAKEVEIFFARGVIDMGATTVGDQERLALVSRQKELVRIAKACIELRLAAARGLCPLHRGVNPYLYLFISDSHHL